MKLSVVVPFYNVERYLHDCLASLAGQTLTDLEVVLVDDGSPDGSRAIAEEFVARDPRFRLITQENQGLGPARNTGMREARGTYLTFVDSDDLVPHDAFRLMTERLDRTGSDFAAGDARRFNIHGIRESWVHRGPFEHDLERTTLLRSPFLASDRMVWNKVYRRTFWEQHGYTFPAMMYEDYPVTLRAYLEATSIEVVSDPIYVWRERDVGELSITQRAYELRNVSDRVTSDLMVLEQVDKPGVPAPVRRQVHDLLLSSDVGAVATAMAFSLGEPDHDAIVAEAQRLVRALDPATIAQRNRLERLRCAMILEDRADVLRHLVDVRDGLVPPLTYERRGRKLLIALDPDLPPVAEELRVLGPDDVSLSVVVESARWSAQTLHLGLQAWIDFSGPVTAPTLRAWLHERGGKRTLPVSTGDLRVAGTTVAATLAVDGPALLALTGDAVTSWELVVELDTGGVRRTGLVPQVRQGSSLIAEAWRADECHWVVSGRDAGAYIVRTLRPAAWITGVEPGYGAEIAITGRTRAPLPLAGAELEVAAENRVLMVPVSVDPFDPTRWNAHVQLGLIADPRHHDAYVPIRNEFPVHLVSENSRWPVQVDPQLPIRRFAHLDREIQFVTGRFLGARIDEIDFQFVLEEARTEGTLLHLGGRWLGTPAVEENAILLWHHLHGTEEEKIALRFDGDHFTFTVDLAALTGRMRAVTDAHPDCLTPSGTDEWLLSFVHAGAPMTAYVSNTLVRRLPPPVRTADATVELSTHRMFAARLVTTRTAD